MKPPLHAVRSLIHSVLVLAGLLFCAGCVSSQDSDLPWNAQRSWESSPMLPGNFEQ